jgi:hypothetical protein
MLYDIISCSMFSTDDITHLLVKGVLPFIRVSIVHCIVISSELMELLSLVCK